MSAGHFTTTDFWRKYAALPQNIRTSADKQFALLKIDHHHPSLHFKKVGERQGQEIWSARITLNYRAVALKRPNGYLWFWVGHHKRYDSLIS